MKNRKLIILYLGSYFSESYKLFLSSVFKDSFLSVEFEDVEPYIIGISNSSSSETADTYLSQLKTAFKFNKQTFKIALFTGGADVEPSYYGEKANKYTTFDTIRDAREASFYHFLPSGIFKIGICRGAQFLTAMSGGRLIQHVTGHNSGSHLLQFDPDIAMNVFDYSFNKVVVTSDHHQMMYPFNLKEKDYYIIGYSNSFESDTYLNGENEEIRLPENFVEPEIIMYSNTKSLCIQGHPEYSHASEEFKKSCKLLILYFISTLYNINKNHKYIYEPV